MFHFIFITEELVLEESPKWKLLADVLDEIERDDAKNDSKRTLQFSLCFTFYRMKISFDDSVPSLSSSIE